MHGAADGFHGVGDEIAQVFAHRVGDGYMGDDAIFKEGTRACVNGVIDDLIGRDDMTRRKVFTKRPDGVDGDDEADAQSL